MSGNNLRFSVDNKGVAILGSEYCSGYIDVLGRWNNGFYCPSSDETVNVFCCGSSQHKYCCTKKDQVLQEEMEGLTLVIGVLVGVSTAILLGTIVLCVCCPWCPNYKKKEPLGKRGSLYPLPQAASSTNTCSVSNGGGSSTTTLEPGTETVRQSHQSVVQLYSQGMSHSYTLPHSLSHHTSFRIKDKDTAIPNTTRKYGTLGRQPREQPPAYHILPRSSYLLIPQDTPDLLSETKIQADTALHSLNQSMGKVNMVEMDKDDEEDIYQSTKF